MSLPLLVSNWTRTGEWRSTLLSQNKLYSLSLSQKSPWFDAKSLLSPSWSNLDLWKLGKLLTLQTVLAGNTNDSVTLPHSKFRFCYRCVPGSSQEDRNSFSGLCTYSLVVDDLNDGGQLGVADQDNTAQFNVFPVKLLYVDRHCDGSLVKGNTRKFFTVVVRVRGSCRQAHIHLDVRMCAYGCVCR